MEVTGKKTSTNYWSIGVRHIVYMALGAALYAVTNYFSLAFSLPGANNVQLRPGIVIPVFFGVVFGPWVGLFTGAVGNIVADMLGGGIYWNWEIGNGLIGFVSGLAVLFTGARYNTLMKIVIAVVFGVLGNIIGLAVAAYLSIPMEKISFEAATFTTFIPATLSNVIVSVILLPIVLVAYNAAVARTGRG